VFFDGNNCAKPAWVNKIDLSKVQNNPRRVVGCQGIMYGIFEFQGGLRVNAGGVDRDRQSVCFGR
jgi:hypothetical protein